ncbi:hypothetical protein [Herbidospora mongoliensis]|uniref:hypothetical protein n=1 Tax=Herbidospora mongoliensis TaxID=688067 RepID=UPI0008311C13|nr:hypothetical protein [Herbidospora mongoliensis]
MSTLRLREVYPRLARTIADLLLADPLAATVDDLPFLGPCTCSAGCANLLTAPPGSASPLPMTLLRDGKAVLTLSLDPSGTAIRDIEVLDAAVLG